MISSIYQIKWGISCFSKANLQIISAFSGHLEEFFDKNTEYTSQCRLLTSTNIQVPTATKIFQDREHKVAKTRENQAENIKMLKIAQIWERKHMDKPVILLSIVDI